METCVIESQKMYTTTPKSVTYRKHVLHEVEPDEFVSEKRAGRCFYSSLK